MFSYRYRFYWLIIFLVGLLLRIYRLNIPLLESQPNRQVIDAFIIRQLYRPDTLSQVDFSLLGFPVYHGLVAGFYYLFGVENLFWGRLISLLASIINFILFAKIVRLFVSERVTLLASFFFFVLSPINIVLSRAIQIEQTTLTFGLAAIYFLARWSSRYRHYYWLSLFFFTLTLAQEATLAYLSLPLLTIFYLKSGYTFLKQLRFWFYFSAALLLAGGWYFLIMAKLNQAFPNGWNVALNPRIWVNLPGLITVKFWANAFYHFQEWAITPIGTILVVLGLLTRTRKNYLIFIIWLIGALISIIYRSRPAIATSYYFFTFVPPVAVLAAKGLNSLLKRQSKLLIIPIAIVAILVTWRIYIFDLYSISPKHTHVLATAQQIKALIPVTARIITSSYSSIILQFYADHIGNTLVISPPNRDGSNPTLDQFYRYRKQGAQYYALADKSELDKNPPFKSEIMRYPPVYETDSILIVNLISQSHFDAR